ncbi:MAG: RNA polymerase sporulation sigma factor SigF [Desulfitobacteriaceae bacterium]|nr:RNA polymerase sporulation sigma factor SigF [Desulfitobacteriaceae bacterium]MDD4752532.1 RNA polymerase sporulation sigma factor SigF [Desulfitobacteriaceae bacterium]
MKQRLSEMHLPRYPLLSEAETNDLLNRSRQGDVIARERLINCNLRLVFNMVQRFQNRGYELEDLFQIGTIGLMKAIDKFDPTFAVKFSTYAVPMIIGEIRRFIRDDNPVKVSRSYKEIAIKVYRAKESMAKEIGREPTLSELSKSLGVDVEDIVTSLEAVQIPASIHDTVFQDEGDPIYVLDQLASESELDDIWFDKMNIKDVMRRMPLKLRKILVLRFFEDRTQVEVAERLGISQVQVSRLERQAINLLRRLLMENSG